MIMKMTWRLAVVPLACMLIAAASPPGVDTLAREYGLIDLSDNMVKLSDFKGRQHVVLVFDVNHD